MPIDSEAPTLDDHDRVHELRRLAQNNPDAIDIGEVRGLLTTGQTTVTRIALLTVSELINTRSNEVLDILPILTDLLDSDWLVDQSLALQCVSELAQGHPHQVVPVTDRVIEALQTDKLLHVEENALRFLESVSEIEPAPVRDAVPTIVTLIEDGTEHKERALIILVRVAKFYPEELLPFADQLIAMIRDSRENRVPAFAALGYVAKEFPDTAYDALELSIELLDESDNYVRSNAAAMLADLADEYPEEILPAVPQVIDLLDDDDSRARYNATSILAKLTKSHPEEVKPAVDGLIDALDETEPFARSNASWALGQLRVSKAKTKLQMIAREDPHEEVRANAEWAIDQL